MSFFILISFVTFLSLFILISFFTFISLLILISFVSLISFNTVVSFPTDLIEILFAKFDFSSIAFTGSFKRFSIFPVTPICISFSTF